MRSPLRTAVLAMLLAGAALPLAAGPAQAADDRGPVGNAQPWAVAGAAPSGAPAGSTPVEITVHLALRSASGLDAAMRRVSDPASPSYGKYLTTKQFRATYAPAQATVDAVTAYFGGYGLKVTEVSGNRTMVTVTGTVAQAQKAFATTLKTYEVAGRRVRAAAATPTLPTSLSSQVIAITGLASESTLMKTDRVDGPKVTSHRRGKAGTSGQALPPPDAFVNAPPCSKFYGQKVSGALPPAYGVQQPFAQCGQVPAQLQGAYGLTGSVEKGFDGRGVTVAITDAYAAPTILDDANTYAGLHGQAPFARGQFRQVLPRSYRFGYDDTVNGDQCGEQGWYGEETLDVEAVHAVAPGANVTYVASRSCDNGDFARTLNKVVDRHLADIVTNSWGGTDESNGSPGLDRAYQQVFYQAALEGIGMYFSSGDSGDGAIDNDGVPTVQSPANSQLVTAVGGTAIGVDKGNHLVLETGWSTSSSSLLDRTWDPTPPGDFFYGGGGGTSQVFDQPWYQQGVVPDRIAQRYSGRRARAVPDISTVGDPNTGMLVGETQTFPDGSVRYSEYRLGGTSLSSPLMAGIMAIADQVYGHAHGFANPAFYELYGSRALRDVRHVAGKAVVRVNYLNSVDDSDGTSTSLRTLDARNDTTIRTTVGYDDITGVGSPNGAAFLGAVGYTP